MSLPSSPTNGQTATLNGVTYVYNSTATSWTKVAATGLTAGNIAITNSTASTSNVTGALVVTGGVGVGGNLHVAGNLYSAGSRTLTAADLATVTYTADYITNNPTTVSGLPAIAGTSTAYGTYNFGDVDDIRVYGDYDTVANTGFYSVNDATGAPGHVEYIGFSNVAGFNRLNYNINYTANSGHTINFELYNYEYMHWDTFATTTGAGSWQTFTLGIIDDSPYIGTGANLGNVTTRINHVSSGNVSHRTWIDYVALEQSITGGQGPRGPTGSTGATGATGPSWAGGYVANVTTFGSNLVANSATTSSSTSTGALVVIGGAGISGTVYAGGIVANSVDLVANAATQAAAITGANAAIVTANTALKNYVDSQNTTLTNAITGANAAIVTANTALKGYVDSQLTNLIGAAPAALDTLYEIANSLGNNASLSSTLVNSITGANAAIVTANTALKNYVDTQDSAITVAWTANAATQQGLIATLQTQVYSNTNVAAYLPTYASSVTSLSITSSTASTSTTTGALTVSGGVGVAGNVYANALYTTTGLMWAGNGTPFSSASGATFTASSTVPLSPTISDKWYNTTTDILYEFQDVGTGEFWVDISSTVVVADAASSTSTTETLSPFLLMGA